MFVSLYIRARPLSRVRAKPARFILFAPLTKNYREEAAAPQKMPELRVKTQTSAKSDPCELCFMTMYFAAVIAALVYMARILFDA
jgi:hypothetical protein